MSGRLSGRRALVSGASRGIGLAIAQRLASDGARVMLVARSAETMAADAAALPGAAQRLATEAGVTRFGDPGEVAAVAAFLCSGEASYMQGAIVDVDGGWVRAV